MKRHRMPKSVYLISLITGLLIGCTQPHETSNILGQWIGHLEIEYEQTVSSDSVRTLESILNEQLIREKEVLQDKLVFTFQEDSAFVRNGNLEVGFWLIPDPESPKGFMLTGDMTLGLKIVKNSGDSLILEEQLTPVTFALGEDGQIVSGNKKAVKRRYKLTRIVD